MTDCLLKGQPTSCVHVDAMLGWLARWLRLAFGIEAAYSPHADDKALLQSPCLVATRDVGLFHARKGPTLLLLTEDHVRWIAAFIALGYKPGATRCPTCGGPLDPVDCAQASVAVGHPVISSRCWRCAICGRHYWRGSHWRRIEATLAKAQASEVNCVRID